MVQQMPRTVEREKSEADWQHICALLGSLQTDEQLGLSHEEQLYRLFHDESTRLLEPERLQFSCSCSKPRTAKTLATLGRDEVESILEEMGSVQITCEFCDQQYVFDKNDIGKIFNADQSVH